MSIFPWRNTVLFFKGTVKSRIITKTTRQGGFLHGAALFYFKFGIDKASLGYKVIKADAELMVKEVGGKIKVKAAGGIKSIDDAVKFLDIGVMRLGTSSLYKMFC